MQASGVPWPGAWLSTATWWNSVSIGRSTPMLASRAGDHTPAAATTIPACSGPSGVWMPVTRSPSRSSARTGVCGR